jgi:hypothetical protein
MKDRGRPLFKKTTRFAAAWLVVLAGTAVAPAAERLIEPGQWKVISATVVNGVVQPSRVR